MEMSTPPETAKAGSSVQSEDGENSTKTAEANGSVADIQSVDGQPHDEAVEETSMVDEYRQYLSGDKPPEYDVEGLVTLWDGSDTSAESSEDMVPSLEKVIPSAKLNYHTC